VIKTNVTEVACKINAKDNQGIQPSISIIKPQNFYLNAAPVQGAKLVRIRI
jgi:hypothetical protein